MSALETARAALRSAETAWLAAQMMHGRRPGTAGGREILDRARRAVELAQGAVARAAAGGGK